MSIGFFNLCWVGRGSSFTPRQSIRSQTHRVGETHRYGSRAHRTTSRSTESRHSRSTASCSYTLHLQSSYRTEAVRYDWTLLAPRPPVVPPNRSGSVRKRRPVTGYGTTLRKERLLCRRRFAFSFVSMLNNAGSSSDLSEENSDGA